MIAILPLEICVSNFEIHEWVIIIFVNNVNEINKVFYLQYSLENLREKEKCDLKYI